MGVYNNVYLMYIVHRTNIKISIFWILGKDICVQFVIEVQINLAKYVVWPDPKDLRTSVNGVDRLICLLGRDSGRWEGRKTRRTVTQPMKTSSQVSAVC